MLWVGKWIVWSNIVNCTVGRQFNCLVLQAKTVDWQVNHPLPAALKWLTPLYTITISASSIALSCRILYSCMVFELNTVIFTDHIQDTANNATSLPQSLFGATGEDTVYKTEEGSTLWTAAPPPQPQHHNDLTMTKLVLQDQLVVVYHEEDHHSPEVPVGKIGGLPQSGSAHQHRLLIAVNRQFPVPSTCK